MKGKRILSAVLSAALLLQLSPLAAFAEDTLPLSDTATTVQTEPAPEDLAIDAQIAPEPTAETPAEPTAEPTPEASEEPTATPTPEPTAEPTATPAAEESAPDAAETPAPEPSAEPTAAPDPAAAVQALIDALPDEVTEDNAEAVEQALTDIDDAKESLTDDELAGLDFARYDAAANALLALWGEAATDAVELLDNYTGPGQENGWYIIDSPDDLYWLATAPKTVKAKLTADIKLNGENKVLNDDGSLTSNADNLVKWTPIGTSSQPFTGTFDGQGKTISGLYFNDSNKPYVGLFGCVGKGGTVKNVNVTDSYLSGNWNVGGICGQNNGGTVKNCTSGCTVTGVRSTGGICGSNQISSVLNCHNTGKVTGTENLIGGVCGYNENSILQESDNTGKVTGKTEVGGVCGENSYGTVNGCYNTGEVSGEANVGGVCGCNINGIVQKSYNIREVSGNYNYVGGVCGQNRGTVNGCYNTGKVTGKSQVGGVCGGTSSTGCYYLDTSGTDSKGESKTELQFKNGEVAYLLQKALDDAATAANKPTTQVWGQRIGNTGETDKTPVLSNNPDYAVHPTATDSPCKGYSNTPDQKFEHQYDKNGVCSTCGGWEAAKQAADGYYEITNQGKLYWFAEKVKDGETGISARLMDDITINSNVLNNGELNTGANFTPWTPIGTEAQPFTGTFDGNNKTISGLYFNDSGKDDVGLFGCVGTNGTVKNVTLADSYVSGNNSVGGICGMNNGGTVEGCRNSGKVSGKGYVGGVCGYNKGSTLEKSYNTGDVSGTGDSVGGVCGYNEGTLQECYNNGDVSGTMNRVGGVCGYNIPGYSIGEGTLQKCYNTGKVTGTMNRVGGVCGENASGTVKGCYTTGKVTGNYPVGSVCGWNGGGTVEKCYYLAGTSAKAVGGGNEGVNCASKTELQFQNGDVAFLLQKDLGEGSAQVWGQRIDTDGTGETDKTPVLSNNPDYAVHPTATDSLCKGYSNKPDQKFDEHQYDKTGVCSRCGAWKPAEEQNGYYQITNQGQLRWFANLINTTSSSETKLNARLMNDITMDSTEWTPIGKESQPFTGTFDGDSHTITGLKCTDTSAYYVGLVGYASGATIQNVTVKESAFNGNSYIGAVCGRIVNGTITNCHAVKTTIGELGRNNYPQYCGGIVGEPAVRDDGTCVVTDCTNSGTVSGRFDLGGIAGQVDHATVQRCFNTGIVTGSNSEIGGIAGRVAYATVQRCFNSGAVTGGWPSIGGIAGKADGATVQDCGNTGAVKRTNNSNECGGIVGQGQFGGSIQNCYNAVSNMAYPIFFKYDGAVPSLSNCYYLADNPGTDPTAKTAAQFASGEVAYLLQGERTDTTTVWGQTLTEPNKQDFPVPGGEKVYQSAPCKIEYTNTESKTVEHDFDNGYCKNCGQPQIAYTVTIPASVELGNTATITAKGVTLPDDKRLNVKVADDSKFEVMLDGDTREYTVTNVTDGETPVDRVNPVLTAVNGVAESSVELQFNKPESTTYSGTYTGTVTFTVSVDEKSAS